MTLGGLIIYRRVQPTATLTCRPVGSQEAVTPLRLYLPLGVAIGIACMSDPQGKSSHTGCQKANSVQLALTGPAAFYWAL